MGDDARRKKAMAMLDASFAAGGTSRQKERLDGGKKGSSKRKKADTGSGFATPSGSKQQKTTKKWSFGSSGSSGTPAGDKGEETPSFTAKAPKSPGAGRLQRGIYRALPEDMHIGRRLEQEPSMRELVEGLVGELPPSVYSSKLDCKLLYVGAEVANRAWKRKTADEVPLKGLRRANTGRREEAAKAERRGRGEGQGQQAGESVPDEEYGGLMPLHALWEGRIDEIVKSKDGDEVKGKRVAAALQTADLHGAMVSVFAAACPSSVGLSGIVSRETFGMIEMVRRDGRVRSVPKAGTRLSLELMGYLCVVDCTPWVGRRR